LVREFYDGFADDYHLAYGGRWDEAVARQGAALDGLIREHTPGARRVLDCSCGIGTQAIGLSLLGYDVVGTDLSRAEIERARAEAARLGARVRFDVADFRDLSGVDGDFDAVISCDNALPHLLDPLEIVAALTQMRSKLRDGGVLVVTMRDFDEALREKPSVAPTVRVGDRVLVRLHEWEGDEYTVRYVVLAEATATGARSNIARAIARSRVPSWKQPRAQRASRRRRGRNASSSGRSSRSSRASRRGLAPA
jgi:SAM-dependent methyltransferase